MPSPAQRTTRRLLRLAVAAASIGLATSATAAALIVGNDIDLDGYGELTGATGVDVGGTLYDVSFIDGTCISVFGGCDADSDFAFTTLAEAFAAADALSSQVFVDGPAGPYDSTPWNTAGCLILPRCRAVIPYQSIPFSVLTAEFYNDANPSFDAPATALHNYQANFSIDHDIVWARFTLTNIAVPEPTTWAVMLLGFGLVGGALRSAKRRQHANVTYG